MHAALTGRRLLIAVPIVVAALAVPLVVASAGTTTAPAGATAGATTGSTTYVPPGYDPAKDVAGSTIRAHEGAISDAPAPRIAPNAAPDAAAHESAAAAGSGWMPGLDVSNYQGAVAWGTVAGQGGRFVYIKATESTNYRNPSFNGQYSGSYGAGLVRGAYHFGLPNASSAESQAAYFVAHGGGWSRDGRTLPPMLDIEYNPYGATCYGLSTGAMRLWIGTFSNEVHRLTGRYPAVYTTTNWWNQCTGSWNGLGDTNPLFIARYSTAVGALPPGWGWWTFWQHADSGVFPGDQDYFNGVASRLVALANG
jgi:GH25 family lysozyme M1 (1,4-beta-N-acetylmuramidase)